MTDQDSNSLNDSWQKSRTAVMLGIAQTLAWASTYYLPAILATPIANELGISVTYVFAAFSLALVVAAFVGPQAGNTIDKWGGRPVLGTTSLVFAGGLVALGCVSEPWGLLAAWSILGVGMATGLYEAAFATVVRIYGSQSRGAITGITLLAGFASTVGWPLSTWLEVSYGWRATCWAWAGLHLVLGLPLNLLLPRAGSSKPPEAPSAADEAQPMQPPSPGKAATYILAFVFAVTWFISTAMAAHLPALLQSLGVAAGTALLVGMLIGPAQVGARLLEFGLLRRVHPLVSTRIAAALHPIGAVLLMVGGPPLAIVFGILHGAGNGILTIAKGTLPLVVFGPTGYGRRQGMLMVPARIAQAAAPWLFGLALKHWGHGALILTALLSAVAMVSLMAIPGASKSVQR